MSQKITATHERVDDIPAIIAHLKKMRVAELLDNHFPTNGNWSGLSLGWTTVVWLAFILSEGDHRLYRVEPWVKEHPRTLRRCIDSKVSPRDLADDRLATILDYLCVAERWIEFERALNQSVLRVYDIQGRVVRIDTTTAAAYVTTEGLLQLGHSRDARTACCPRRLLLVPAFGQAEAGSRPRPCARPRLERRAAAQRTPLANRRRDAR